MSIEYHGWIALATSQSDWSDGDFEAGYRGVTQAVAPLRPEEGHEPLLPACGVLPRVLYLKGSQVDALDPVIAAVERVCALFDRAYGELAVLQRADLDMRWDSVLVTRYLLVDGRLTEWGR